MRTRRVGFRFLGGAIVLGWGWLALGCPAEAAEEVAPDHAAKMTRGLGLFDQHVRAILLERCWRCHGGESTEGELSLANRERLLVGGGSGPAVVPGQPDQSLLVQLVRHENEPKMPLESSQLPAEEIAQLVAWIECGAPYSAALDAAEETAVAWTDRRIDPSARDYWAFRRLADVTPPPSDDPWCRTPVDQFIRAAQVGAGIVPNPPADRRTLIRRLYFDLLGLPPTPDEIDAFVYDPAPDAYARLVDRLLESPHYGERWARHWLDLARFAESHGFEHDYDRPTAYHFRDFVIRAWNDDLPYDDFVRWQLAGDEYEPENPLAWMATGFLAAGVHSTQITKNEVEKHRYDELDDIVATIGTTFLGLTVGCARCHDHKYDPIPQADYYRLVSTFTTTVRADRELNLEPARYARARAEFDAAHAPFVAALARFEAQVLPGRAEAWAAELPARRGDFPWVIVEPHEAQSTGGATLEPVGDGSFRATGKNPDQDTFTWKVRSDLAGIAALKLEALADPALVRSGPGRAANGNFALSDLKLTVEPSGGATPIDARLVPVAATFEQPGLPLAAAIDADPQTAWAIDPEFGRDHAAVFRLESPPVTGPGTELVLVLSFANNKQHALGRMRLSLSTAVEPPDPQAGGLSEAVWAAAEKPAAERTSDDLTALARAYAPLDADWRALKAALDDHQRQAPVPKLAQVLVSSEGLQAVRLHTQGEDFLPETHYLRRGDPHQKEKVAEPGVLQVLGGETLDARDWFRPLPWGANTSGRRRALAEWLVDVDRGAGALTARVIVNRLWQHHLGRGIVASPSDFGARGEAPTHPELLEWLAADLVRGGWRLKRVHRLILTSAVYQQSAARDPAKLAADPENRLVWRYPARRLEAEAFRDAILATCGLLDRQMFGPGTLDTASRRRSIYFTVKRSQLVPMMQVFDAPDALSGLAERPTTTVAPQALYLINNSQVHDCALALARQIAGDESVNLPAGIAAGYRAALGREPRAGELAQAETFIRRQQASYAAAGSAEPRLTAWADFCQVLLSLNEFAYVD